MINEKKSSSVEIDRMNIIEAYTNRLVIISKNIETNL